ncbi:DMT family transporter [Massilia endophytica]|uniref:DMT family transporter n=1 Tax=Massilia endophytica TaxID=2899220 RepID=UPI001E3729DA|nr:DMT family transporter [Massilia endophytica]UGQ45520.1 DMT family transporter [Massilia endophytica]
MNERTRGYLYLTGAMALVGSTVVASKLSIAAIQPMTATAIRFAIATPLFLLLMWISGTRFPRIGAEDLPVLLTQCLAGSVGYTVLLMYGLRYASASDAGLIIGMLPVVSALCAVVLLKERPDARLVMAVLVAGAGVALIALRNGGSGGSSIAGNLLVGGAVLCEALFLLLQRRLRKDIEPLALSTILSGTALLSSAVLALGETGASRFEPQALQALAYYAAGPTVVGFVLWYAGARRVSGTEAAVLTAIAPASTLVLAMLVLGEQPGWREGAGLACVLAAMGLLMARAPQPRRS